MDSDDLSRRNKNKNASTNQKYFHFSLILAIVSVTLLGRYTSTNYFKISLLFDAFDFVIGF